MRKAKKVAALFLVLSLMVQCFAAIPAFAADKPDMPMIIVDPTTQKQPVTGYDENNRSYYIDVNWSVVLPTSAGGQNWTGTCYDIEVQEVGKGGTQGQKYTATEIYGTKIRIGAPLSGSPYMNVKLKPGTFYYIRVQAKFVRTEMSQVIYSQPSGYSDPVGVMTDLYVVAAPHGKESIKITWDDVWLGDSRIAYNIWIADKEDFGTTRKIRIDSTMIGEGKTVTVNNGRLEYIHDVNAGGRVQYIKIEPIISTAPGMRVFYNPISAVQKSFSYILVKATKMYTDPSIGTVWKLEWNDVLRQGMLKGSYDIRQKEIVSGKEFEYFMSTTNNSTYITVDESSSTRYKYKIVITPKDIYGNYPFGEGFEISSDEVELKDMGVITTPEAPVIVDSIRKGPNSTETYDDSLHTDRAAVLWKLPTKPDGTPENDKIDYDVLYDIVVVTDPTQLDNPPASVIVHERKDVKLEEVILNGEDGKPVGCKYEIQGLSSNTTYYFKVIAKKDYIDYVDGQLEHVPKRSEPAYRVIVTPGTGNTDKPLVPARPPLKVKRDELVTKNSAVVQVKNQWYERFNTTKGKWEYIPVPTQEVIDGSVQGTTYRKVQYDDNIRLNVGCIEYTEGFDFKLLLDAEKYPADKVKGISPAPNDPEEDPNSNIDRVKHNVDILVGDLEPNKVYVIWVRAVNTVTGKESGPSDPLLVTTKPDHEVPVEDPIVPALQCQYAGDTYVELIWDFKEDYKYDIRYSTKENVESAEGKVEVLGSEVKEEGFLTVTGLKPGTLYFFWIRAKVGSAGEEKTSLWSDSLLVATKEELPPEPPRGFGIKNAANAITKSSITYEWTQQEGLEYILEIADNSEFKDAKEYTAGKVSEFKAEGLRSNKRYYARLYAYNPEKKLKSQPTQNVIARTLRSEDDYDSNEDTDDVISGDYIIKDPTAPNYTWNIKITGVNADRFIEHIRNDRELQYLLDLSKPPSETRVTVITISSKVFRTLTQLQETLAVATASGRYVIRPGTFENPIQTRLLQQQLDFDYRVVISTPDESIGTRAVALNYKTPVSSVRVYALDGANVLPVDSFDTPLRVMLRYSTANWYKEGTTSGYLYEEPTKRWIKAPAQGSYDSLRGSGLMSFELKKPGAFAAAEPGGKFFDDVTGHWAESTINRVASVRELKSIPGRNFKPDGYATMGDTVKVMFDILGYSYDGQYMTAAVKSGLLTTADLSNSTGYCSREKAISMAVRLYEIKTGEKTRPEDYSQSPFYDMDQITAAYRQKVGFAVENGIAIGRTATILGPRDNITRAELLTLLEKYLVFTGELE